MTLKQKIRCYMLLLLICSAAAFVASAQTPATATDATTTTTTTGQPQKTSEQQALERKALALLDELAGGADALRLPENRALVRASVADILWTHDEKRAPHFSKTRYSASLKRRPQTQTMRTNPSRWATA